MVYIDDILVVGETFEDHLLNLRKVFDQFWKAGLRLNPTKCHLVNPQAIQELDLQIHYQTGKQNANADALSRSPVVQSELSASSSNPADVIGTVGVV